MLQSKLAAIESDYKAILAGDVAEFNKAVEAAKLPPIVAAPKLPDRD